LRRNTVIDFDEIQLIADEKFLMANGSIDATKKNLTFYFKTLVPVRNPVTVRGSLWYSENDKYLKVPLLDISINICQNFKTMSSNPLVKATMENIWTFGMLPKNCPIRNVSSCVGLTSPWSLILFGLIAGYLLRKGHQRCREIFPSSYEK
jgi:Protein of unknown function (DUF1091)